MLLKIITTDLEVQLFDGQYYEHDLSLYDLRTYLSKQAILQ